MLDSEIKKVTTESESSSDGVVPSVGTRSSGEAGASPEELALTILAQQETINALKAELDAKKASSSDDSINKLAELLSNVVASNTTKTESKDPENLNKSTDFKEKLYTVDGQSLMESQAIMQMYKGEEKKPISIPRTMQEYFGPALAITVNGVRVAIPCDGKTYYINETHYTHARERMAKVDKSLTSNEPNIVEINS